MEYCNECKHFFTCKKNNWVVTMDSGKTYNSEPCCDNLETEHWGIWNDSKKQFMFGIDVNTRTKAKQELYKRVSYDALEWGFQIRKLPKEKHIRIIAITK